MPVPWPVPVPIVLVGGAAAVVVTAAVLSHQAARQPDLPSQRWSRPLPVGLTRAVDAPATRRALASAGLLAVAIGCVALGIAQPPIDGMVALPPLIILTVLAGPVLRAVDPVRLIRRRSASAVTVPDGPLDAPTTDLRIATVWLLALFAIVLSTRDPLALAVTVATHVLVQAALARWRPRSCDPLNVLTDMFGHLAAVGRTADGVLAWRNPLVEITHVALSRPAVTMIATVIAASVTHALVAHGAAPVGAGTAVVLIGMVAVITGVLRLGVIRPFMRGAVVPLGAAYGAVAAGRWWPPLDLLVFVALHMTAIAVLHRQAVARHDLRTARAVQFPLRVVVVSSVVLGLALMAT